MKRVWTKAMTALLLLSVPFSVSADDMATPYQWCCRRNAEHRIPDCDPQLNFIDDYPALYADKAADEEDKVVYLTFDAGYENGNVSKVLDVLAEHEAKAAFFILSHLAESESELVQRMSEEGHLVCNHTASHRNVSKMCDKESFLGELKALEQVVRDKTGVETANYFRPPEGRFSKRTLEWAGEAGYTTVFWSFAYADWDNGKQPDSAKAKAKILDNIHNGAILLLHPTSATNAAILDEVMTELEEEGYRFGSLDEINVPNRV